MLASRKSGRSQQPAVNTRRRALRLEQLEDRRLLSILNSPLIVNSTKDLPDRTLSDGMADAAAAGARDHVGTLRAAIEQANHNPGLDVIKFDIPGTGPHVIKLDYNWSGGRTALPLPEITGPLIIDGLAFSHNGRPNTKSPYEANDASLSIELDGSLTTIGSSGFDVRTPNCQIHGLAIHSFLALPADVTHPYPRGGAGIALAGGSAVVTDTFLGMTTSRMRKHNSLGIGVFSSGNLISENLIVHNDIGVQLGSPDTSNITGNTVEGNFIGVGGFGDSSRSNDDGIMILNGAFGNVIGGPTSTNANIISGNKQTGIFIKDGATHANTIEGNRIGTDCTGKKSVPNGNAGIFVENARENVIKKNLISGNDASGVWIDGAAATSNEILNNQIGTDFTGAADLGNGYCGVLVESAGGTIIDGNLISGSTVDGVRLKDADDTQVKNNKIGTDINGQMAIPNEHAGVMIDGTSRVAVTGNLISGNSLVGVMISGTGATGNRVEGNKIGTTIAGDKALKNGYHGVMIHDAPGNTIGGSTATERNIISGNGKDGVRIEGKDAKNNTVSGNYIGVDLLGGTVKVPNEQAGVFIDNAPENTIGGSSAELGNVISGNGEQGVVIKGADATENRILGNLIGTDKNGLGASIGNSRNGILIDGGPSNHIGERTTMPGTAPGNLISGNGASGVYIKGKTASGDRVQGNVIGADALRMPLPNRQHGVRIEDAPNNVIGEISAKSGTGIRVGTYNIIAGNGGDGVRVEKGGAVGNSIRMNEIFGNKGLGINLVGNERLRTYADGVTPNDEKDKDSGPNDLINFPVGVTARFDGITTHISGVQFYTFSTSSPERTRVDVFANSTVGPNDVGQGEFYLGTAEPYGHGHFYLAINGPLPAPFLSAVLTSNDGSGSTSEFSPVYGDPDGDGLVDSDGDGLPDDWETKGIDTNADGKIDLDLHGKYGAKWNHKDIYLEIDHMQGREPLEQSIEAVITAFKNAPVGNPDGRTGITLHANAVANGDTIPLVNSTWFDDMPGNNDDFWDLKRKWYGSEVDRKSKNSFEFRCAHQLVFHYCIFVNKNAQSASGMAEPPGNDVIMSTYKADPEIYRMFGGRLQYEAMALMHELGHNLGLGHGGPYWIDGKKDPQSEINFKPNYLSIMNYAYASWATSTPLDYSRFTRQDLVILHEEELDERLGIDGMAQVAGLGNGPDDWSHVVWSTSLSSPASSSYDFPTAYTTGWIDWNGNGIKDVNRYALSINESYLSHATPNVMEVLESRDDWSNLAYNFRCWSTLAFADLALPEYVPHPDGVPEQLAALAERVDADGDGYVNAHDNVPFVFNPMQEDGDGDGVGDAGELVGLSLAQTGVSGGDTVTGTVELLKPAPAGGAQVRLYSSNLAAAQVPTAVLIPEGASQGTFTIQAMPGLLTHTVVTISVDFWGELLSTPLTVAPVPVDLALETTAEPDPVGLGKELDYTITVTNRGPQDAANVTLTDTLPDGVEFVSAAGTHTVGATPGELTVTLDYTYDTNNFFDTQEKRDLMQMAADMLVGQFGDDLAAIMPGGGNSWTAIFENPATGADEEIVDLAVGDNELLVFVGGRDLGASGQAAQEMGHGGPGGYALSAGSDADFVDAVVTRGEVGAHMDTPTDFGTWGGAIAFNMNPIGEFYFGKSEPQSGSHEVDFLSVALHEMAHVLGVGAAESWQAYADEESTAFLGPTSRSVYGDDVPLQPDLVHWQDGIISDGREAMMDPSIMDGERKLPTTLDMAGLYDLGWEVVGRDFPPKPVLFPEEGGFVTCELGQLAPGASTTVTITVKPTVPGAAVNTATVSHGGEDPISWNNIVVTTTSAGVAPVDTDQDGVLDGVEDAGPAGGDANGDGTADRLQNAVASLPSAADGTYMTLELIGPGAFRDVRTLENPASGGSPAGVDFPVEFFSFVVETTSPGDATTVTFDLPAGLSPTTYYRFGPTPDQRADHWYEFLYDGTTGAEILADRIVLHLVDGQRGDDDLTADGTIVDAGAPAIAAVSSHSGLIVTGRQGPNPVTAGQDLTYLFTVTNQGSQDATDVTLTGNLPDDFQFISATTTDGTFSQAAGVVTFDVGTLAAGHEATVTVRVIPTAPGTFTATATVDGTVFDPDLSDNTLTLQTTVLAQSPLVVNSVDDVDDGFADATHTSLREAIRTANAMQGMQTIVFDIPGAGPHTIQPASALPEITDPVVIDATTEPDYAGTPVIEIDGSLAGAGANGLYVTAGDSVIRGLVINRFQVSASQTGGNAVLIEKKGGNVLEGNYLGTDVSGAAALGNQASGIEINFADDNTIGGTTAAERNVIGGNETGVMIVDSYRNAVQGNYIGTSAAGDAALPNESGILLSHSGENTIGGAASGAGNVISGNDGVGLTILASHPVPTQSDMHLISGNLIGTAADGVTPLGNGSHGVFLDDWASAYVGKTDPGAGNTIAYNGGDGVSTWFIRYVSIRGNSIFSNTVLGIDLDADGVHPNFPPGHFALLSVPNYPVLTTAFSGAGSTTIEGDIVTPYTNFHHQQTVMDFYCSPAADPSGYGEGATYLGTHIVPAVGSITTQQFSVTFPIDVPPGHVITATSTKNHVPSEFSAAIAVLADSDGDGVLDTVEDAAPNGGDANSDGTADSLQNQIVSLPNAADGSYVFLESSTTIRNVRAAENPSPITGPSGMAFPIGFFAFELRDATGTVTVHPPAGVTLDAVYNYGPTADDTTDHWYQFAHDGQTGAQFAAGAAVLDLIDNHRGDHDLEANWRITTRIGPGVIDPVVVETLVVNTTDDVDDGTADATHTSLREAINASNALLGRNRILFDISGSGPHTIEPITPLPEITDPAIIDGYSQPGAVQATASLPATLMIELSAAGLRITGGNSVVRGLAINGAATAIALVSGGGNTIEGNYLGTDVTGTAAPGGQTYGIEIAHSSNNTIGGTTPAARNVISGCEFAGIITWGDSSIPGREAEGNVIQNNLIGTDVTGTSALANGIGVAIGDGSNDNTIGGASPEARNIISGNGVGVEVGSPGEVPRSNKIQGNFIGTDITGTVALANGMWGVSIWSANETQIGGIEPGAGNLISGNLGDGIRLTFAELSPLDNVIQGNFIGTDWTGTAALGNVGNGILIEAFDTTVGGAESGAGNVIAYNTGAGVIITPNVVMPLGGEVNTGNRILSNSIHSNGTLGIDLIGDGVTPNDPAEGGPQTAPSIVSLTDTYYSDHVVIEGTVQGSPNTEYFVELTFNSGGWPVIYSFPVNTDGAGAVDFSQTFWTTDPLDSATVSQLNVVPKPNRLQNYPVLTAVDTNAADTTVSGSLDSHPNTTFRIEFFSSPQTDPSGYGEGQTFLGATDVTTDATGMAPFVVTLQGRLPWGHAVTATATDPDGNTSEFSAVLGNPPPAELDFGDASQATLLVDDGARHVVVPGYYLGAGVDTETDGHPSDLANGDDSSAADDEDGVVFLTALTQSALAGIEVTASARGHLDAWVDFNNNGHFGDTDEQVFTSRFLSPGANTLYFSVPGSATVASATHARFRFSTEGGLSPMGLAADGEVEDYAVTIQPGNVPPTAVDDDATAEPGVAVEIDVAANDTDGSGDLDPASVTVLLSPAHGAATVDPLTGIVSYTSEAGFAGTDQFIYEIFDGAGQSDTALVTIRVALPNQPLAANDDAGSTEEETPVVINVVSNDSAPGSPIDPASVTVLLSARHGSLDVDPVTGEVTYTPYRDFTGIDAFYYEVRDAEGISDTAQVTVAVSAIDDPPVAEEDAAQTTEGTPVVIDVAANDEDADGDLVSGSVRVTDGPTGGAIAVDPVSGEVTYTPRIGFVGNDTFTYEVFDSAGLADTAVVTIEVLPSNYPPTANDDTAVTSEDAASVIDVLANDSDVDGNLDLSSVRIASDPFAGTVSVDTATGQITYTPDTEVGLLDWFTYEISDANGATSTALVTVVVTDVNDAPTATDIQVTLAAGAAVDLAVWYNDVDLDGVVDPLTTTIVSPPGIGMAELNADGTVRYNPTSVGTTTFTYTVRDNEGAESNVATVDITVIEAQDDPCSISGFVYVDMNNDGVKDNGDVGLGGVLVHIDGPVALFQQTALDGSYTFSNLPAGTYDIWETQPSAFLDGVDKRGTPLLGQVEEDRFSQVTLEPGTDAVNYDFGEGGLIPELISKRLFLASTPSMNEMLRSFSLSDGDLWLDFEATEDTVLRATLQGDDLADSNIELYGDDWVPLALSAGQTELEMPIIAGEKYALHVASGGTDAELQITDSLNHAGDSETIVGTAGDDLIEFIPSAPPGQWTVRVNGLEQHFQTQSLVVAIDGLEGNDTVVLRDTPGNDVLVASPHSATFTGVGFHVEATNFTTLLAYAKSGGDDTARLTGSPGSDKFKVQPQHDLVKLYNSAYYTRAKAFDQVLADAGEGRKDRLRLWDTAQNDHLDFTPGEVHFTSQDGQLDITAQAFEHIIAFSKAGGADSATLQDSPGDDTFRGRPHKSTFEGPGFDLTVRRFEKVEVHSDAGGNDRARLFDTAHNDRVEITATSASLSAEASELEWLYRAFAFEWIKTYSLAGGDDHEIVEEDPLFQLISKGDWQQ